MRLTSRAAHGRGPLMLKRTARPAVMISPVLPRAIRGRCAHSSARSRWILMQDGRLLSGRTQGIAAPRARLCDRSPTRRSARQPGLRDIWRRRYRTGGSAWRGCCRSPVAVYGAQMAAPRGWLAGFRDPGTAQAARSGGRVDGAHQPDVIAVGIGHDRPPGTPEGVERRLSARIPAEVSSA